MLWLPFAGNILFNFVVLQKIGCVATFFANDRSRFNGLGQFVVFSDIHFDPYYGTPDAYDYYRDCSNGPPQFSIYGCESSEDLVRSAIANAARVSPNPDFILFTGDMTRHGTASLGKNAQQTVYRAFTLVESLLRQYFPNQTVLTLPPIDLGNNDFESDYRLDITSLEPCFVETADDGTEILPNATNSWLSDLAITFRSQFISESEAAIFACGGYLSREINNGLDVIVLNSLLWSDAIVTNNYDKSALTSEDFDPFGQHAWLAQELTKLRKKGKKAYITGHIPPIAISYYPYEGRPLLFDTHSRRYHNIIAMFSDVVSGQLFGHTHSNELRVSDTLPADSPPILIVGAVSPIYGNHPGFSVVTYNRGDTKFPLDLTTYHLSLSDPIDVDKENIAEFKPLFSSLLEFLSLENLTNSEVLGLAGKLVTDENGISWIRYWQQWYQEDKKEPTCNGYCRIEEACIMACGSFQSSWKDCVANKIRNGSRSCSLPLAAYDVQSWHRAIIGSLLVLGSVFLGVIIFTRCRRGK